MVVAQAGDERVEQVESPRGPTSPWPVVLVVVGLVVWAIGTFALPWWDRRGQGPIWLLDVRARLLNDRRSPSSLTSSVMSAGFLLAPVWFLLGFCRTRAARLVGALVYLGASLAVIRWSHRELPTYSPDWWQILVVVGFASVALLLPRGRNGSGRGVGWILVLAFVLLMTFGLLSVPMYELWDAGLPDPATGMDSGVLDHRLWVLAVPVAGLALIALGSILHRPAGSRAAD